MGVLRDIKGMKFGRITVLERSGTHVTKGGTKVATWLCECECGNVFATNGRNITSGKTRSCGCLHFEALAQGGKKNATHGGRKERLYGVWVTMRKRCLNPNATGYRNYGGRGIGVCDEWNDYSAFRAWAMQNGYDASAAHGACTLDRIDVNGNYEPSNCRWVDMKAQAANRRSA